MAYPRVILRAQMLRDKLVAAIDAHNKAVPFGIDRTREVMAVVDKILLAGGAELQADIFEEMARTRPELRIPGPEP